ncbi:hypothetical protein N9838_00585 [Acidimicrobiia bacterium]|jgi:hypothetical protein|nr:hypothetical protein [Acidimicrobiia bacterium]
MTDVPVLIFHNSFSNYLKVNCEITSRNNKVIFLGDSSCSKLGNIENVDFYNYNDFINYEKIDYYKTYFKNYNTKGDFVWVWYFKLFAILDFLNEMNMETIFHIDSDNILLDNINKLNYSKPNSYFVLNDWNDVHMTGSIHSGLTSKNLYEVFVDLYEDIFVNKSKLNLIQHKIDFHKVNGGGGICDMTFFYLMNKLNLLENDNLLYPKIVDDSKVVFMTNYGNGEGFETRDQYLMQGKFIKIFKDKKNTKNYIFDKKNNEYLQLMNIHFQGKAKKKMNNFLKYTAVY